MPAGVTTPVMEALYNKAHVFATETRKIFVNFIYTLK